MSIEAGSSQDLVQLVYKGGSLLFNLGKGGIMLAVYLQARLKAASENKLYGRIDMSKLNKDGQPIHYYHLRNEDFKKIKNMAKKYGIQYGMISDKKGGSSGVDLFIRTVDAPKFERLLYNSNIATIMPDLSGVKVEKDSGEVIRASYSPSADKQEEKKEKVTSPLSTAPSEKNLDDSAIKKHQSVRAEIDRIARAKKPKNNVRQKRKKDNIDVIRSQLDDEFRAKCKDGYTL
ncbi:MAG: DUF3801 domain-containing protein [Clostridiales bacterium]|nr:DUF3801 domain-containing protein [Clostridiales bacterium]